MTKILIEIDGKLEQFDAFYDDDDFFGNWGAVYGMNETTKKGDKVRNFALTTAVYVVNAYRVNDNGSIFGMQALFKNGKWKETDTGEPLFCVWDRII